MRTDASQAGSAEPPIKQIKYETSGELSCLHSTRQGPSPPLLLSPELRCGSPRATGPTPWCWSNASADLDLSSGSGGFDIDRADGSVTAKTGDGAIRIGRLTRGQAELLNGSGNIEVGISEGTAARVDANSERGSVRNSVPPQENPETWDNEVTVHARTRHGDIIIQRAAN